MKKHIISIAFCLVFSFVFIISCKKTMDLPPATDTFFKIKKNGVILNDSILSQTVLFYIGKNGATIHDPDNIETVHAGSDATDTAFMYLAYSYLGDPEYKNSNIAFFRYITQVAAREDIHSFYLRYPDGDVDTLWLNSESVSNNQGAKESCYCTTPIRELKFNGKEVTEDTSIQLSNRPPVYLFEK